MKKQKLSHFGHIKRYGALGKYVLSCLRESYKLSREYIHDLKDVTATTSERLRNENLTCADTIKRHAQNAHLFSTKKAFSQKLRDVKKTLF